MAALFVASRGRFRDRWHFAPLACMKRSHARYNRRMPTLDLIAEQRIAEAIERGELSNLPGAGKPLELDDDALIPQDLRLAYRVLKNAGFAPPEVEQRREIHDLRPLIATLDDDDARRRALMRLNLLLAQTAAGRRRGDLRLEAEYLEKVAGRLTDS